MFSKLKKDEFYLVKDLYIGILGHLKEKSKKEINIKKLDKIIIYKKEKYLESYDYYAKNIFTNQKYLFFKDDSITNIIKLMESIDNYAIYESYPLELILKEPTMKVTKKELLNLYKGIVISIQNKSLTENKIIENNDIIFNLIIDTIKIVKESNILNNIKNEIIKELEDLELIYFETMTKITEDKNFYENIYYLRMDCIRRLVELETKYKNSINIQNNLIQKIKH